MSDENKKIINQMQTLLKKFGYEVKTSHLYEVLAQMSEFNSWNVASAKKVEFEKTILAKLNQNQDLYEKARELYRSFWKNEPLSEESLMGIKKNNNELLFINQVKFSQSPNALFVGSMGSGKSIALVSTVLSYIKTHPNNSLVFIIDPLKGAMDYQDLFSLPKVVPIINDEDKIKSCIELLHKESRVRLAEFQSVNAQNYMDYEKKTGKTIDRCLMVIEEFHFLTAILKYDTELENPDSIASKFKNLLRTGRSLGIFVLAASQKALGFIPPSISTGFTNVHAFRMGSDESQVLIGSKAASLLTSSDRGVSCSDDENSYLFPYFSNDEIKKIIKEIIKEIDCSKVNCLSFKEITK